MVLATVLAVARPAIALPGDLDPGFATGGLAIEGAPPGRFQAVTTQVDRKVVAADIGWRNDQMDFQVVRYSSAGVRAPSFGLDGRVLSDFGQHEEALAVTLQPD